MFQQRPKRPKRRHGVQDAAVFEHIGVQGIAAEVGLEVAVQREGHPHRAVVYQSVQNGLATIKFSEIGRRRHRRQVLQKSFLRGLHHIPQQLFCDSRFRAGGAVALLEPCLADLLPVQQLERVERRHLLGGAIGMRVRHGQVGVRPEQPQHVHHLFGDAGGSRHLGVQALAEAGCRGRLRDHHLVHVLGQALVASDRVDVAGRDRLRLGTVAEQHVLHRVAGHQVAQSQIGDEPGIDTLFAGQFEHRRMDHRVQQRPLLHVGVQLHEQLGSHFVQSDGPPIAVHQADAALHQHVRVCRRIAGGERRQARHVRLFRSAVLDRMNLRVEVAQLAEAGSRLRLVMAGGDRSICRHADQQVARGRSERGVVGLGEVDRLLQRLNQVLVLLGRLLQRPAQPGLENSVRAVLRRACKLRPAEL